MGEEDEIDTRTFEDKSLAVTAAHYMFSKGTALIKDGYFNQASALLQECYALRKTHLYGNAITADTLFVLAEVHRQAGAMSLAESLLSECLDAQVLLYGLLCEQSALCIHAQAEVKRELGYFKQSGELYVGNLSRRIEIVGNIGAALLGVAYYYYAMGKYFDAFESAEKCFMMRMKMYKGLKHLDVLDALLCKSKIQNARGDCDNAKSMAEQSLANIRFLSSDSNPMVVDALATIGNCLLSLGRYDDAMTRLQQALDMGKVYYNDIHYIIANILMSKAKTLLMMGNHTEVKTILKNVDHIIDELTARGDCGILLLPAIASLYAEYHKYVGNYLESYEAYKTAIDLYNVVYVDSGPSSLKYKTHSIIASLLLGWGDLQRMRGMYDNSADLILNAGDIIKDTVGKEHMLYATYEQFQGDLYLNRCDFENADKQLRRCMILRKSCLPEGHYDISVTLNSQGECARFQEEFGEAEKLYGQALEIRTTIMGDGHISLLEIQNNQALLLAAVNAKKLSDLQLFNSDSASPCPPFNRAGFLEAGSIIQQCILRMKYNFDQNLDDPSHPYLVNMIGNFGVIKKIESLEKTKFRNKLSKAHRKKFKENEDTKSSGAHGNAREHDVINFSSPKESVDTAGKRLLALGISLQHHWMDKFNKYNVEEVQDDEMELALNIVNEGHAYALLGKYRYAEDKYEIALELINEILVQNVIHPAVISLLLAMAENYMVQARYLEARALYNRSLSLSLKYYDEFSTEVGKAYFGLGCLYLSVSHIDEARGYFDKVFDCWGNRLKEDDENMVHLKIKLGEIEYLSGSWNETLKRLQELLPSIRSHPSIQTKIEGLILYGRSLLSLGLVQDAITVFSEAEERACEIPGTNGQHPYIVKVKLYQAQCTFDEHNYNLAMMQIMSATNMASKFFGLSDEEPSLRTIDDILALATEEEAALSVLTKLENYAFELESEEIDEAIEVAIVLPDVTTQSNPEIDSSDGFEELNPITIEQIDKDYIDPSDSEYVFSNLYEDICNEVFTFDKINMKAHPLLADIIITKAIFLMICRSHERDEIGSLLELSKKMTETIFGTKSLEAGYLKYALARFAFLQGSWDQSMGVFIESGDIYKNLISQNHPTRLDVMSYIAEIKRMKSEFQDSLNIHSEVWTERKERFGENHPKTLFSLLNVLHVYRLLGKYKEVKDFISRANAILSSSFSIDSSSPVVARSLSLFGEFACDQGQYDAAVAFLEKAISMYVSLFGESDYMVADCLFSLSEVFYMQGKLLESKKLTEQCLEIRLSKLIAYHSDIGKSLLALGNNYFSLGAYDKALILYKKAFVLSKGSFKTMSNCQVVDIVVSIAELFRHMGYFDGAEKLLTMANNSRIQLFDLNHPSVATSTFYLNNLYYMKGNIERAILGHEETIEIRRNVIGPMHRDVASSLHSLGLCLLHKGLFLEARSLFDRCLTMRKKLLTSEHFEVGETLQALGKVYLAQGKLEEALVLFERTLTNRKHALGTKHPLVAETLCAIADVHNQQFNTTVAYDLLADSLKIRRAVFGNNSLITTESLFGIANNLNVSGIYTDKSEVDLNVTTDEGNGMNESLQIDEFPLSSELKLIEEMCEPYLELDPNSLGSLNLDDIFYISGNQSAEPDTALFEYIDKSSFISSGYMYDKVKTLRMRWLVDDHPLLIEVKHAINVNNIMAGKILGSTEQSEAVLFLRRKVLGERHMSVVSSYLDLATSLRMLHRIETKKLSDSNDGKPKNEARRAGPTLVDQLKSSLSASWSSSTSAQLSDETLLPAISVKKKKIDKTVPIGFMGYAYPERKNLFDEKEPLKFGKLRVNDAMWLLEAAIDLYKEVYGRNDESPLLASILFEKGELLNARRQTDEARKIFERCTDMRRKVLRSNHPAIAQCIHSVGETYRIENEVRAAEPLYQSSLDIKLKECGGEHPLVAETLNSLAMLHFSKGQYATAKVYYLKALDLRRRILGDFHPAVAQTLNSLAGILHLDGNTTEAEKMYKEAIEIKQLCLGDRHPDFASALNNLGLLLKSKNKFAEAKAMYERAIDIQENHFGPLHPDIAASLNNLAALYFSLNDLKNSKNLYKKSIEIKQKVLGIDHPSVALAMNNLAGLLYMTKELTESIDLFTESLRIRKSIYGDFHPLVAESMNNLSVVLLTNGESEQSDILYSRSLEILIRCYSEIHPTVIAAKNKRKDALELFQVQNNTIRSTAAGASSKRVDTRSLLLPTIDAL